MMSKRMIGWVLAAVILFSASVPAVSAYADDIERMTLDTVADGVAATYEMLYRDGRYYLNADVYPRITRYQMVQLSEPKAVRYVLGTKTVDFYCEDETLRVSNGYCVYEQSYSGALIDGGQIYLPVSETLPWLNTNVEAEKRTLVLSSDPYSYWELCHEFVQPFNIADELGDDFAAGAALVALNVFDGFANLRFDKLLPAPGGGLSSTETLFDFDCYIDCFLEMATDDSLTTDVVKDAAETVSCYGKMASALDDIMELDEVDPYRLYTYVEEWEQLKMAGEVAGLVGIGEKTLRLLELNERAVPEQVQALTYFAYNIDPTEQTTMATAAREASAQFDGVLGNVVGAFAELISDGVIDWGSSSLKKAIGTSLSAPLSLVKNTLKLAWPSFMKATKGVSALPVYQNVMLESRDLAFFLRDDGMDMETVNNSRLMLIMAYKASKMSYDVMDKLMSSFGGDGLLAYKTDAIDLQLFYLAYAGTCTENDSVEGKAERAAQIDALLEKIVTGAGDMSLFNETYWCYQPGVTNGSAHIVQFHSDGTYDGFSLVAGVRTLDGEFFYDGEILSFEGSDFRYIEDENTFESINTTLAQGAEVHEYLWQRDEEQYTFVRSQTLVGHWQRYAEKNGFLLIYLLDIYADGTAVATLGQPQTEAAWQCSGAWTVTEIEDDTYTVEFDFYGGDAWEYEYNSYWSCAEAEVDGDELTLHYVSGDDTSLVYDVPYQPVQ